MKEFLSAQVFGFETDAGRLPGLTKGVKGRERFALDGLEVKAMHIPGHTLGAVAYLVDDAVFTGDTLFVAGCGRLFEGTPAQMYDSINTRLGGLSMRRVSLRARVHREEPGVCGRARAEQPGRARQGRAVRAMRARGEPSVPSTIERGARDEPVPARGKAGDLAKVAEDLAAIARTHRCSERCVAPSDRFR